MKAQKFENFNAFFQYYLREHSHPSTRKFHVVGTLTGLAIGLIVILCGHFVWLWTAPVAAYGINWYSHARYQKNFPVTRHHPWWSFLSDFKMVFLYLVGRLR